MQKKSGGGEWFVMFMFLLCCESGLFFDFGDFLFHYGQTPIDTDFLKEMSAPAAVGIRACTLTGLEWMFEYEQEQEATTTI